MIAWHRAILFHAELAELYEAQSDALFTSGRFSGFCDFCVRNIFLRENDKLICLIGKFTLLLQRQTVKTNYYEEKLFVSPLVQSDGMGAIDSGSGRVFVYS